MSAATPPLPGVVVRADVPSVAAIDERPRLWVVDDHDLLVVGLRSALGRQLVDVEGPGELDYATIIAETASFRPHLALVDLQLGEHRPHGIDLVAPIVALGCQVVLFTGVTDRLVIAAGLEAGASGVIGKHQHFEDIVTRIRSALAGFAVTSPAAREQLLEELRLHRTTVHEQLRPFERLSPHERLALHDMVNGMTAEEMAEAHVVSLATVRSQIRAVLQKLSVHSQLAAVAYAARVGWQLDREEPPDLHRRW